MAKVVGMEQLKMDQVSDLYYSGDGIVSHLSKPKGGEAYVYEGNYREDWRKDGYRWRQNGTCFLPKSNPQFEKTYFSMQTKDGLSNSFAKYVYRKHPRDGQRRVVVHYIGDESIYEDFKYTRRKREKSDDAQLPKKPSPRKRGPPSSVLEEGTVQETIADQNSCSLYLEAIPFETSTIYNNTNMPTTIHLAALGAAEEITRTSVSSQPSLAAAQNILDKYKKKAQKLTNKNPGGDSDTLFDEYLRSEIAKNSAITSAFHYKRELQQLKKTKTQLEIELLKKQLPRG